MSKDGAPCLGTCCACGCEPTATNPVRSLIFLDYKNPAGERGWGCFQCGALPEGASAVVCDRCAKLENPVKFVMAGVNKCDRIPVDSFEKIPHEHDMSKHPECEL